VVDGRHFKQCKENQPPLQHRHRSAHRLREILLQITVWGVDMGRYWKVGQYLLFKALCALSATHKGLPVPACGSSSHESIWSRPHFPSQSAICSFNIVNFVYIVNFVSYKS
jgi:hypothetical protein